MAYNMSCMPTPFALMPRAAMPGEGYVAAPGTAVGALADVPNFSLPFTAQPSTPFTPPPSFPPVYSLQGMSEEEAYKHTVESITGPISRIISKVGALDATHAFEGL